MMGRRIVTGHDSTGMYRGCTVPAGRARNVWRSHAHALFFDRLGRAQVVGVIVQGAREALAIASEPDDPTRRCLTRFEL